MTNIPNQQTHLMIDFETLSTRLDCVVLEFGWCLFDPYDNGVFLADTHLIDPQCQMFNRRADFSTIQWWMVQNEEARKKICINEGRITLMGLMTNVVDNFPWKTLDGFWSHGATFDIAILTQIYEAYGKLKPWNYKIVRDTRTLFALTPGLEMVKPEIAHSAMHDAIAQARTVQNAYHRLFKS